MLARLSSTARFLDARFQPSKISVPEDEALVVDLDSLRSLVLPLSDIAWRRMAGMCGRTISPMYQSIQCMLSDDMEHVAQVLSELEPPCENDFASDEQNEQSLSLLQPRLANQSQRLIARDLNLDAAPPQERPRRKRRRSSIPVDHPLIIPSTHPSVPTIIITPCLPQPRETSCRIPYQDSAFHARLTVPAHPVFNQVFPPMASAPYTLPTIDEWKWLDGHWQAILPELETQAKKGMFSRALTAKRQACRTPRSAVSSCDGILSHDGDLLAKS